MWPGRVSSWLLWSCLCSLPLENKEAQVSALQCVSQLSLIPQAGEEYSPILSFHVCPLESQTTRHLSDTDSRTTPSRQLVVWLLLLWVGPTRP